MTDQLKPIFTWRSALAGSELPPAARLVGYALSLHMNERGGSAFPGPALLAQETGLHLRTVKRMLAELERLGWVECIERGGIKGEKRRANVYAARVPDPVLPVASDHPCPETTGGLEDDYPWSSVPAPVASGHPRSSKNSTKNLEAPPRKVEEKVESTDAGKAHLALIKESIRPGRSEAS